MKYITGSIIDHLIIFFGFPINFMINNFDIDNVHQNYYIVSTKYSYIVNESFNHTDYQQYRHLLVYLVN